MRSYEERTGYENRRERLKQDPIYREQVFKAGTLASLTVGSVFVGTGVYAAEAATNSQQAVESAELFEPMAESLAETAGEILNP